MPIGIPKSGKRNCKRRAKYVEIKCPICGKTKEFAPSFYKIHPQIYCSRQCSGIAIRERIEIACVWCGKKISRYKSTIKTKNYCSVLCRSKAQYNPNALKRNREYINKKSIENKNKNIKLYRQKGRERYQKNKENIRIQRKTYNDKNREHVKAYHKKYYETHKDRKTYVQNMWNAKNKSKVKSIKDKYRILHKDEIAVKYNVRKRIQEKGDLTGKQWACIKKTNNYTCLKCHRKEPEIILTIDHIIPIIKGGEHTANNIQPLCRSCNSSKHDKIIDYRQGQTV